MSASRRRGRESALQIIYSLDYCAEIDGEDIERAISEHFAHFDRLDGPAKTFAERLVRGAMGRRDALAAIVDGVSARWRMDRMARIDRSLIQMAAYEILHCADIPKAASINEALEIAKRYGGEESVGFVNGILDQISVPSPAEPIAQGA